jgi:cell division protein FtsQ
VNQSTRGRGTERARQGARTRPERGHPAPRWRRWVLPAVLSVVTILVFLVYFTPLLGVRTVQVSGNSSLPERDVLAAADVRLGKPMLQVDSSEIQSRLQAMPSVASARVELSWPSTVRLDVVERVPVAFLANGGGVRLVDAGGMTFADLPQPPPGLPELRVRAATGDDPVTRAALTALVSLPAAVRGDVTAVTAQTPHDIRLLLTGNREVDWGDASQSERKAAILPPLLTRPGRVYDVTSPALPTVA